MVDFGASSAHAVLKGLKAGQKYNLELRINNAEFINRGVPFKCWGLIRLGGFRLVSDDQGIEDAVRLAKSSDSQ